MNLSHRITHLIGSGSDGWDLFNKAREMIASGINVTELTIGEHDIRTDAEILKAMHVSAIGGHTGYASIPGVLALREQIAARVTDRTGVPTSAQNVMITPGGQSALFAIHSAVCDEGDAALFIDPYYATYPGTIRGVGAMPRPVPARAEHAFQPQPEDIEAAATGARRRLPCRREDGRHCTAGHRAGLKRHHGPLARAAWKTHWSSAQAAASKTPRKRPLAASCASSTASR